MSDWAPTADEVAVHLPARFNGAPPDEHSLPSRQQVEQVIAARVVEVRNRCGRIDQHEELWDFARETVAIGTASYIESNLFPEQGEQDAASVFLRIRFQEHCDLLRDQVMGAFRQSQAG